MNQVWRDKLNRVWLLLREQLTESSTLRGIVVLVTVATGWAKNVPIDAVLAVAVVLGAALKIVLPDRF